MPNRSVPGVSPTGGKSGVSHAGCNGDRSPNPPVRRTARWTVRCGDAVDDGIPAAARSTLAAATAIVPATATSIVPTPAAGAVELPQVPATVSTPALARPHLSFRRFSARPRPAVPAPAAATTALTASGPAASALAAANFLNLGSANSIGDFISGALLMLRRTFLNQAPSASATQALVRPSGKVFGYVSGSDPEGEKLTYTVKKAHSTATSRSTTTAFTLISRRPISPGTDSFTIVVDTPGFHINLLNVLNPFGGSKKVVKVAVNANAADPAGTVSDAFNGAAGSQPNPLAGTINTGQWIDSGVQTYTNSTENVRLDGQGNLVLEAHQAPDKLHLG